MTTTIFERPVFQRFTTGEAFQILSFNDVTGAFKLANVVTGVVELHTEPLDAERISFSLKTTRKWLTDYTAITYVLSQGVTMVNNIPDWLADKLVRDNLALNILVRYLERFERMLVDSVKHDTGSGVVLFNTDLRILCTSLLLNQGAPNESAISDLRDRGFNTRPLNDDMYGWEIPVVETKRGLLIFG